MSNNPIFVIVYAKDNKIKCLSLLDSLEQKEGLKSQGWVHTQTIDPCTWMEHLHNSNDNKIKAIKELSNR